ncbi:MAG: hypothetical protein LQ348_003705 [Seirophora lacunosa]|nr:MAG: hypothetical protein LQ348_003705 [Seirophora lacunosa]
MPSNAGERSPDSVKERASIQRILNEDTEKTVSAEVEAAARALVALSAEDHGAITDDEDEHVKRKDDFDFIAITDFTNGASSTGPPRPFDETRDVPALSKQGHAVGGPPLRCINPEVVALGERIYKPEPMSVVYRRKVPLKRFSCLPPRSDAPDVGASESNVTAVNHPVIQQAVPAAAPTVIPFTAINHPVNPPANHQVGQQRSAAARKPAVKKLKVEKPAWKPATEKVSVPVAAPPQEESQVVEKTSSGRIIKRRKIYEG